MNGFLAWQNALTNSWIQVWSRVFSIFPMILAAIVVFSIGILVSYWVKKLVIRALQIFDVNKHADTSGINKFLKKSEIKLSFVDLVGSLFEWIVILVFFLAVVDILGLTAVSRVLTNVLNFIPNVLVASLIVGVGYLVANVVGVSVRSLLTAVDGDIAKPVGRLARGLILVVSVFAAIDQLKIAQGFINTFFQGLTYTTVLVIGLSVGLGAKDLVAKVLDDWYKKVKKK